MPRCQRTFHRLTHRHATAGSGAAHWTCAHCPDAETYEAVCEPDLLDYLEQARVYCADRFGPSPDGQRPTLLLRGLRPECVYEPEDRRYEIYLQRGSDGWQLRLQIGHEMFHRACSRGRIFHWTHEMLACLTSVRLLRRAGMEPYAARMERDWLVEAGSLGVSEMLRLDLWTLSSYPPGFYGRAFATGAALTQAVGWDNLRRLARCASAGNAPDVDGWLASLPPELAARARRVLGCDTGFRAAAAGTDTGSGE